MPNHRKVTPASERGSSSNYNIVRYKHGGYLHSSLTIGNAPICNVYSFLNPSANIFVPKCKKYFSYQVALNPLASEYAPRPKFYFTVLTSGIRIIHEVNCFLWALYTTCLILSSCLYRVFLFTGVHSLEDISPKEIITNQKLTNPNKIALGHLNINSIRAKFQCLRDIVGPKIDI